MLPGCALQPGMNIMLLLLLYFLYFPPLFHVTEVLLGFSSSQEAEVICLPVELACSEQQLPWFSFSNLPARGEVPVPSVP